MNNILLGFILGFLGLFFPNARTLSMVNGERFKAVSLHVIASIMWAVSINKAAQMDLEFILGNIVGGGIAIWILADRQRKEKDGN